MSRTALYRREVKIMTNVDVKIKINVEIRVKIAMI